MKKNILIVVFGINFFLLIALLRAVSLGQDINKTFIAIAFGLSVFFGVLLYFMKKKNKGSDW